MEMYFYHTSALTSYILTAWPSTPHGRNHAGEQGQEKTVPRGRSHEKALHVTAATISR